MERGGGGEDHWGSGNREGRKGKSSKYEGRDGERGGGGRITGAAETGKEGRVHHQNVRAGMERGRGDGGLDGEREGRGRAGWREGVGRITEATETRKEG